ncbi:hypothetical protein ACFQWC_06245 [Rossellomorea sp. GCM10028870]|uniref:hypothetical protein n=1 Tax=Rossellomorea sp. GCM10028870 TaxID=3273426 RepID=UPI00360A8F5C
MSKQETIIVLNRLMKFIESLPSNQYDTFINGGGKIQFIEAKPKSHLQFEKLRDKIQREAEKEEYVESLLKKYSKKDLVSFCEYINITTGKRDTKEILYKKISCFFSMMERRVHEIDPLERIASILREFENVKEVREYLLREETVKKKTDLMSLAKCLEVHVTQKQTKQEIFDRIVESVEGSRMKGKAIREKV